MKKIQLPTVCPDCKMAGEFTAFLRKWPAQFVPNQRVLVTTCWECGYKRAVHVWIEAGYEEP